MSDDSLVPKQKRIPSFDEFKNIVLQQGNSGSLLDKIMALHGKAPRLIRILHNFDPTGITSAINEFVSEEKSEREQDNILQAIYALALKVWNAEGTELPSLSEEKFCFLYYVYVKSQTNLFARAEAEEIQSFLNLPQQRILSIGEYLDEHGLISFRNWYEGVRITHKGVVRTEAELVGSDEFPAFVDVNEVKKMEERIRLRFEVLQYLHRKAQGNTYQQILHEDIAKEMDINHDSLITQALPYMVGEGWVVWGSNDSVRITEEGIDRVKALLTQKPYTQE